MTSTAFDTNRAYNVAADYEGTYGVWPGESAVYNEHEQTYNDSDGVYYGPDKSAVQFFFQTALQNGPLDESVVWETHTDEVLAINGSRGRQSALGRMEAGVCSIVLRSQTGKWDPDNPLSPLYPNLKLRRRCRIMANGYNRADPWPVFDGFIEEINPNVEGWGNRSVVLSLVDAFKLFATEDLPSIFEDEILSDNPQAWYRLGEQEIIREGSQNPLAIDSSGNERHGYYLSPEDPLLADDPLYPEPEQEGNAVGDDNTAIKSIPFIRSDGGAEGPHVVFPYQESGSGNWAREFWVYGIWDDQSGLYSFFHLGLPNRNQFSAVGWYITMSRTRIFSSGDSTWTDRYTTQFRQYFTDGSSRTITHQLLVGPFPNEESAPDHPWANTWNQFVIEREGTTLRLMRNGVVLGTATTPSATHAVRTFATNGPVLMPGIGYEGLVVDEVIFFDKALGTAGALAHYEAARKPGFGETADQRLHRVLDIVGWPQSRRIFSNALSTFKESELKVKALDYIHRISEGEQAPIYMTKDGSVRFRNRQDIDALPYTELQGVFGTGGYWETRLAAPAAADVTMLTVESTDGVRAGQRLFINDPAGINEALVVTGTGLNTINVSAPGVQYRHEAGATVHGEMPMVLPEPDRQWNDSEIINSVRVGRVNGSVYAAKDLASIDEFGESSYEKTNLLNADDSAIEAFALRILDAYSQPRVKIDAIKLHSGFSRQLDYQMVERELEDMIQLVLRPYGFTGPVFDYFLRIQKISFGVNSGRNSWEVRWDVGPADISI